MARYRVKGGQPLSRNWKAFLNNHVEQLASIDFFTIPTAPFRVWFCLVVLSHERRKVVPFNVTACPTAAWTAPQMVEAFPFDQAPQSWLRDRDPIHGEFFHCRVGGMGIEEVLISPACPIQTP